MEKAAAAADENEDGEPATKRSRGDKDDDLQKKIDEVKAELERVGEEIALRTTELQDLQSKCNSVDPDPDYSQKIVVHTLTHSRAAMKWLFLAVRLEISSH